MKVIKKNVEVELRTVIEDEGDRELTIVKQSGKYFKKDNVEVISYIEKTDDLGAINNLISIRENRVNINRSGSLSVNQQFLLNEITECLYSHPYGKFLMEIKTKSITNKQLTENNEGQVIIVYETKLNGQKNRNHHLTFTYMEGNKV